MDKLYQILKELHPDVDFRTRENLIEDMVLDSFDIATLVTEIAEEYDVVITAKDILPENFSSAKAMSALIRRLREEA